MWLKVKKMILFKKLCLFFLGITYILLLHAEEMDLAYQDMKLFMTKEQRHQLDNLRKQLELGRVSDDLPTEVEKTKPKPVEILPKVLFKGMVIRKNKPTVVWIENENNFQQKEKLDNGVNIKKIEGEKVEIGYQDFDKINLKPGQVFVPSENKVYDRYQFLADPELKTKIMSQNNKNTSNKKKENKPAVRMAGNLVENAKQVKALKENINPN